MRLVLLDPAGGARAYTPAHAALAALPGWRLTCAGSADADRAGRSPAAVCARA